MNPLRYRAITCCALSWLALAACVADDPDPPDAEPTPDAALDAAPRPDVRPGATSDVAVDGAQPRADARLVADVRPADARLADIAPPDARTVVDARWSDAQAPDAMPPPAPDVGADAAWDAAPDARVPDAMPSDIGRPDLVPLPMPDARADAAWDAAPDARVPDAMASNIGRPDLVPLPMPDARADAAWDAELDARIDTGPDVTPPVADASVGADALAGGPALPCDDPERIRAPVHDGDAVIDSDEALAAFRAAGYREVDGALRIRGVVSGDVELPSLRCVAGDVDVSGTLPRLVLSNIDRVGGFLRVADTDTLDRVDVAASTAVRGLEVLRNADLVRVSAPDLASAGTLWVTENSALVLLELPRLERVTEDGVEVTHNDSLLHLTLPELSHITPGFFRGFTVWRNESLETVETGLLLDYCYNLGVSVCPSLHHVTIPMSTEECGPNLSFEILPSLVGLDIGPANQLHTVLVDRVELVDELDFGGVTVVGALVLFNNSRLANVVRENLECIGSVSIQQNPLLPQCVVDALVLLVEDCTGRLDYESVGSNCANCPCLD